RLGQMLGYPEQELANRWRDDPTFLVHPDDAELYGRLNSMRQALRPDHLISIQVRLRHRDGGWRWVELRTQLLTEEEGRVEQLLSIAEALAAQRASSESVRDGERRYRLPAENMRDVVLIRGDEMQPSYISPSVQQVSGYNPDWL